MKEGAEGVRYREKEVEGLVTPPVDRSGRRIRYCVLEVRSLSPSPPPCRAPSFGLIRVADDVGPVIPRLAHAVAHSTRP